MPKDERKVKVTKVSFEVIVEFVGYGGCVNGSADTDRDGSLDSLAAIVDHGLFYDDADRHASCACVAASGPRTLRHSNHEAPYWANAGSYLCQWSVDEALVDSSPVVTFAAAPDCPVCYPAHDHDTHALIYNSYGGTSSTTNKVYRCDNCTLGSAQVHPSLFRGEKYVIRTCELRETARG